MIQKFGKIKENWKTLVILLWEWKKASIRDDMVDPLIFFAPPNAVEQAAYYLVTSKNACSSIKLAILKEHLPDDYSIHHTYAYNKRLPCREAEEGFSFTFVRNPLERLVSCYVSKYHTDVKRYHRENEFRDYLFGYLKKDKGFEAFVKKIVRIPARLMDRHFCLQSMVTHTRNGKPRVDFIGAYEHLREDFEPIRQAYGFWELPHYNVSEKGEWRDFYTLKTARMIHRKFRKDFRFFDYEQSYRDLLTYLKEKKRISEERNRLQKI